MYPDYFYSDPHFGHARIIMHANRPFDDVHQVNEVLIANYNDVVRSHDTVWWLGDCTFDFTAFPGILRRLNGRKVLIPGNHDKSARAMSRLGFDMVLDGPVRMTIAGVPTNSACVGSKALTLTHVGFT